MYTLKTSLPIKILNVIGLIVVVIIFAMPFIWMISTSLKTLGETMIFPPKWLPDELIWENFMEAWNSGPFLQYFINSVIVSVGILMLQFITVIPAAYAFARYEFRCKNILFGLVMVTMMIPAQLIFLPVFLNLSDWRLLDTLWGLILPFATSAFGIFMLRQTFKQVPEELLEAARLDNSSEFKIMMKMMVPMAKPTLITLGLFNFITHWNDYFWPLVMTTTERARTLPVGIAQLRQVDGGVAWNILMAGNVILVIPILITFFFAQRQIIRAFTYTGVK
ncbi:carbohydrate ABC transporter permease [Oceanobacillus caeni]|nr:carbohydrate ABC transporter permease [Oceanobacillus caeni]KKE78964.1 sugar ABC transporter permease [Bacilli bacterium VT-13-104]PZD86115.1 carbohydrate ABC transporter permease [Bacilli bacterium]MCR1835590.1 carbohydrate ABC transporter permease [Oceanobacillus caeni]PZD89414.1 carbohydrate ABC transporter permease [Bacilli bacterium]PZD90287.1 carbohydrate ABC transporter permease [Bacilli bacterium]